MDRLLLRRCLSLISTTTPGPSTCFRHYSGGRSLLSLEEQRERRRRLKTGPPAAPIREIHDRVKSIVNNGGDLNSASRALREAIRSGVNPLHQTSTLLMKSMCKSGLYQEVISLFNFLYHESPCKDKRRAFIDAYNALIEAHMKTGHVDQALQIYNQIASKSPSIVDSFTYRILTQGLVSANRITEARNTLQEMPRRETDTIAYNNVISAYLDRNDLETANHLLNDLTNQLFRLSDSWWMGMVYARFMEYYFKNNMEKEAMQSYQTFLDTQGVITYPKACNSLLEVLLKYGKSVEANLLFEQQLNIDFGPDCFTYTIMVNECFRIGNALDAVSVFKKRGAYEDVNPFAMDSQGYNNIIGKLYYFGEVAEADKLFHEMLDKSLKTDTTTFRIVLDAWFRIGRIDDVLKWFNYMLFETNYGLPGFGFQQTAE